MPGMGPDSSSHVTLGHDSETQSNKATVFLPFRMRKCSLTNRRQFLCAAFGIAVTAPIRSSNTFTISRHLLPVQPGLRGLDQAVPKQPEAVIEFESSDAKLAEGFRWAKSQALAYARTDGTIGPWYEAALPGRDAFCMRDVSHQSTGAQFLGLGPRTLNMLRCFAASISASKKWCAWWEITRDGVPAPVDYNNDHDFWYDLPASFDVVDACYRQWLWSRNDEYMGEVFLNFYERTLSDYVKAWDRQSNGLLEHLPADGHMGIATYDEDLQSQVLVGSDLIAAQHAAYRDYAAIERSRNEPKVAVEFERKAEHLQELYNTQWWDSARNRYFGDLGEDGKFHPELREGDGRCTLELPLYYGLTAEGSKTESALDLLEVRLKEDLNQSSAMIGGVEGRSYMPDIFYKYGRCRAGYSALTALMDPNLKRREYPEVSFSVIGNLCSGLMGIRSLTQANAIETLPQLTTETSWAVLHHAPIGLNSISLRHTGLTASVLTNESGPEITWQAAFPAKSSGLLVNGKKVASQNKTRAGGSVESYCDVRVSPGETCTVSMPPG
jgi:hypothetical protein